MSTRTFRRGEIILKEGETPGVIYVVQSGLVSVFLSKQKKNIELYKVTTGQLIGEEVLYGMPLASSAQAINDVSALEVKVDFAMQAFGQSHPALKLLIKAIIDKNKAVYSELKSLKGDSDSAPCPPDHTAKVFACIFHVVKYYGEKKDDKTVIGWPTLKRYAQRLFLESPIRLEQAFNILVKLKWAEVKMIKNDTEKEAVEEMGPCTFFNLSPIEKFFEFYQNFYFKGANPNILKYDEKCAQTVAALLQVSEKERTDHSGVVIMNYKQTTLKLKEILGENFTPDQIVRLETKGLFVKRESSAQGGILSFIRPEFAGIQEAWKILREVEKWNELGFVDLKEFERPKPKAAPAEGAAIDPNAPILTCSACLSQIDAAAKFCSACGAKVNLSAA